jgi:hypothetical protein
MLAAFDSGEHRSGLVESPNNYCTSASSPVGGLGGALPVNRYAPASQHPGMPTVHWPVAARVVVDLAGHTRAFPTPTEQEYAVSEQSEDPFPEQLDVRLVAAPTVEPLADVAE